MKASNADSLAIIHRRDAVHLLEGTIEIGCMLETAAVGDVFDRQCRLAIQQVTGIVSIGLDNHREVGGDIAVAPVGIAHR